MSLHRGKVRDRGCECTIATRIEGGRYRAEVRCGRHVKQYEGPTGGAGVSQVAVAVVRNFVTRLKGTSLTPAKARRILHDTRGGRPFKRTGLPITEAQRRLMGAVSRGNPRQPTYVTRSGGFGVSFETSTTHPGVTLHTYRFPLGMHRAKSMQKGEGYGKRFATHEEAEAWAVEHGYLDPYYPRAMVGRPFASPRDVAAEAERRSRALARARGRKSNPTRGDITVYSRPGLVRGALHAQFRVLSATNQADQRRAVQKFMNIYSHMTSEQTNEYFKIAREIGLEKARKTNHWLVPLAVGVPAGMLLGAAGMHRAMAGRRPNASRPMAFTTRMNGTAVRCNGCHYDVPRAGRGLARHVNPRSGDECRGNPLTDAEVRTMVGDVYQSMTKAIHGDGRRGVANPRVGACKRCRGQRRVRLGKNVIPCPMCCRRNAGPIAMAVPGPAVAPPRAAPTIESPRVAVPEDALQFDLTVRDLKHVRGRARTASEKQQLTGVMSSLGKLPKKNPLASHKPGCQCIFHSGKIFQKGGRL